MTTATLARGPPVSAPPPPPQEDDDDEDALMDEEDGAGPANSADDGDDDSRTHGGAGGAATGGLMIDETDQDMSDDGGEYSSGDIVDYSGHGNSYMQARKPAGSSGSLSDGDGEQDNGNGSVQSYDEYSQGDDINGKKGGSPYPGGGVKMSNMSLLAKSSSGSKNGKNFVCDICLKTFSNAANMRRHRVRHSGIKPFECRFCQKRFFRKDHMREHMNHKHNNTQMECYFCQQVFDKEKDLFQHVTRDHDVNPRELHCQYCSFSATTIGRYLWHMTTSHPRKNSHYIDGTGEALSMAPYALDNSEYESPQASPKVGATSSREVVGSSSSSGHGRHETASSYDYMSSKVTKREHPSSATRERRVSTSPPQSASVLHSSEHTGGKFRNSTASNHYYSSLDAEDNYATPPLSSSRKSSSVGAVLDAVRYVSILPNKFLPPGTSSHHLSEDLTSSYTAGAEDLSGSFPADCKSAFAMLQRKMNGNSAFVAAAFAAAAVADSTGKGGSNAGAGGSNRRKSKAPVRMAATPEELQNSSNGGMPSSSVVSSSKRDRDILNEGARNGNDVGQPQQHFSPILEEVMSQQHHHRTSLNNFPEDLSSSSSGHSVSYSSRLPPASGGGQQRPKPLQNGTENAYAAADTLSSRAASDVDSEQKCPHCLIVYPDNVLYMLHKMLHTKDHPYRCAQCLIQFPNRYEFYAHIVNHGSAGSSAQ